MLHRRKHGAFEDADRIDHLDLARFRARGRCGPALAARSGNGNLVVDGGRTAQMLQQLEERAASGGALPVVAALLVGAAGGLLLGCCCCRRRKPKARYESVSMAVE